MKEREQNKRRRQEDGQPVLGDVEESGFVQQEELVGQSWKTKHADGEHFLTEGICNKWIYKKYTFQTICASSLWVCNNLTYFTVVEFKIRVLVVHVGFQ